MMSTGLVRTTTYFDANLLACAKKRAIDEQKNLYEFLNENLGKALGIVPARTVKVANASKKPTYADLFGPPLNARLVKKTHLTRADYYE